MALYVTSLSASGQRRRLRESEETARQLSRENAIVAEIGRIVSSTLNIDEVYERFAEKVRELIPFDRIGVSTINSKKSDVHHFLCHRDLMCQGCSNGDCRSLGWHPFRGDHSVLGQVCSPGRRPETGLIDRFPRFYLRFQAGIQSLIAIPLISKDEVIGVLYFESTRPNAYCEKDLRLAERVGNQIAGAIANAQLFKERQRAEEALRESEERARQLSRENAIVAEIGRIVSSTLNIDDVYERFAEKVRELISFDRIGVSGINPRDHTFTISYVTGLEVPGRVKGNFIPLAGTLSEEIIHTRTSMLIQTEDLKTDYRSVSWALNWLFKLEFDR